MSRAQFVTGATGFVGGALVLELLRATDDVVICGVRGSGREHGQKRLEEALAAAASCYGEEATLKQGAGRLVAVPLDITDPTPDLGELAQGLPIDGFWHSAASLKFEPRYRKEIFRDNVAGTRNVLALARRLKVARFLHISTAYVAGRRTGRIEEGPVDPATVPSNCYEESKIEGEGLVLGEREIETRVLRPSIVIGHSRTHAVTSFTGLYGFIREIKRFQRKVEDRLGAILTHRSLSVIADPEASLNVVPVDHLAHDAVAVGLAATRERIFHLTNDTPARIGESMGLLFRELGFAACRFAASTDRFSTLDETLHREIDFYNSYLISGKSFARSHTDTVAGRSRACAAVAGGELLPYLRWYLRRLEKPLPAEREAHIDDRVLAAQEAQS